MTHEEILNTFDARCFDEVAELKKIFYSFFVQSKKIVDMKQGGQQSDKDKIGGSKVRQLDKDKKELEQQLKLLYEDKRLREEKLREDERYAEEQMN